jgi:glycosyltransferase involved in cell wall biosynthesis
MIALLGKADSPTDAVEDYCLWLGRALAKSGWTLDVVRMPWPRGWASALLWLWRESRNWQGQWILVQYTVFAWSQRGFPLGLLAVLQILRWRGARCGVVFHDPVPYAGDRPIDRLRRAVQLRVLRSAYRRSARSILTIPVDKAKWLTAAAPKAVFIPVGANFSGTCTGCGPEHNRAEGTRTVAVFGVTGGKRAQPEVEAIKYAVLHAAKLVPELRLVVLGRGAEDAAVLLRAAFQGSSITLEIHGVIPPDAVECKLRQADVLLFVRGGISTRRGSAIAAIVCELPVVAYRCEETAPPMIGAGVVLVLEGDREGLAEALGRVLQDDTLRAELSRRNIEAREKYFSWKAVAGKYAEILNRGADLEAGKTGA